MSGEPTPELAAFHSSADCSPTRVVGHNFLCHFTRILVGAMSCMICSKYYMAICFFLTMLLAADTQHVDNNIVVYFANGY